MRAKTEMKMVGIEIGVGKCMLVDVLVVVVDDGR